jgi:hypothetical protein
MRPEITAKWAREKATAVLGEKIKKQVEQCLNSIENAVKRNEFQTSVSIYADILTIQELNKRGFKTEKYSDPDPRDGDYLKITW